MDYEKAYKAVLKTATQWIKDGCTDKEKICLECVFPQLRESEDERIRKEMIAYFAHRADVTEFIDEGEDCKRWISYLEKQKENPKNADSIPPDCVSSAKCEDRWHKVGDSLPDNPREVLCKDEAGNYFIGRYYVGEGWEISNYDDEDKPHHLNPPVSKWIDFPSEKQKEQKPIDYPYLPGWRKNRDNNKPELKRSVLMLTTHGVAEGEWLGEKWCQYRWSCELKDGEVLYWIHLPDLERLEKEGEEKQKEQKPNIEICPHSINSKSYKMQKPAWSEEDEKILNELLDHCNTENATWYNWLKSLRPSWKPSEEQMRCFDMVLCDEAMDDNIHRVLVQLREQLKRLM